MNRTVPVRDRSAAALSLFRPNHRTRVRVAVAVFLRRNERNAPWFVMTVCRQRSHRYSHPPSFVVVGGCRQTWKRTVCVENQFSFHCERWTD